MSFRDEEIFESFGEASGGRREYFGADGYSFGRLGKVETRKELDEFAKLCRRLSWRKFAKRWWNETATPEQKARIYAYRQQWARENWQKVLESGRKAKKKRRARPEVREQEAQAKRRAREPARNQRRAELVYTCAVCGVRWCQLGRIPARPPKYCTQSCRGRANYLRGKSAAKPWAMRAKEFRTDRRAA